MKIITVAGTRPELIRLSEIICKLDEACEHTFVYTNQNSDPDLSDIFFKELNIRKPDYCFPDNGNKSFGVQISDMFKQFTEFLQDKKFDRALILGDTNSSLLAIILARIGVPVYHLEGGNRCYDLRSPEEVNRKIIDHSSSYHLVYTNYSKQNLLAEGIHHSKIFIVGNPISEIISKFEAMKEITKVLDLAQEEKDVLNELCYLSNKKPSKENGIALCTIHRHETVTDEKQLLPIVEALSIIGLDFPVIFPTHPKTIDYLKKFGNLSDMSANIYFCKPVSFYQMMSLYEQANIVITDSGTVQEEAAILKIPCIVARNYTERRECVDSGCSILSGTTKEGILRAYDIFSNYGGGTTPEEYGILNTSNRVIKILLGE